MLCGSLGEGSLVENGYTCMYGWVPLPLTETGTALFVNQLCPNTKHKIKKKEFTLNATQRH